MINWNSEPYNDDYNEDNKFLKVLFRPGKAVQARELNQIQSIIQNQISRHGSHIFKEGAMVIPGQVSIDKEISFIRLRDINDKGKSVNSIVEHLIGKTIFGQESGVSAQVIYATKRTFEEPATLFVRYVDSGDTGNKKEFIETEVLNPKDYLENATIDLSVQCSDGFVVIDNYPVPVFGKACIASIERGVYYVNGYFVLVDAQTIILEKFKNDTSCRVGLSVSEELVVPEDDESLLDNSQGTPNYAAPGAHRYRINLKLERRSIDSQQDKNFIELVRVEAGITNKEIRSTEYSILEQTLARRTYDESGDYVVKDFNIDVREDRNNDRGIWTATTQYYFGDVVSTVVNGTKRLYVCFSSSGVSGTNAPTHTSGNASDGSLVWTYNPNPVYNRGINVDGNRDMISIGIEPGKAYVQGYEIEKIATERIRIEKARTAASVASVENGVVPVTVGCYALVKNPVGIPRMENAHLVYLYKNGILIGDARLRGMEYHGELNGVHVYKLFVIHVNPHNPSEHSLEDADTIVDAYAPNPQTRFQCQRYESKFIIYEPNNTSMIYPLPYYAVKSVNDQTGLVYSVVERRELGVVAGQAVFNIAGEGKSFSSVDDDRNYIIIQDNKFLNPNQYTLETQVNSVETYRGDPYVTTLYVKGLPSNSPITVWATIRKIGGRRKNKILKSIVRYYTQQSLVEVPTIFLRKSDGFKLISIKTTPAWNIVGSDSVYTLDVTDRYLFDGGQRIHAYLDSRIVLKGGYSLPSGPIRVEFQYFDHVGDGDYFDLHSYDGQIPYEDIPILNNLPLRDCFDFRPRRTDDVEGYTPWNSAWLPKRASDIYVDFEYYMGRKCKVCVDYTGKFFVVEGEPSLNPGEPEQPNRSMTLYNIELRPYTFDTSETNVKRSKVDNRRFTMRDIGRLEKRIDTIEYYTSLSLLEQDTNTLSVVDESGFDRFKNGFVVDNFKGHGTADVTSSDYRCSMDMAMGELRPFFIMNNINMIENASTSAERNSAKYQLNGDVITLPILDHIPLVDQPYASRTENVNPFAIFTFIGSLALNPSTDEWFETDRLPDIVNNVEGNFNSLQALAESSGALGTVWNSWQTVWTGTPVGTGQVRNVRETNQAGFATGQGIRDITLEMQANEIGQRRTGIETSIVAKIDREIVEDRVVSTTVIPYIRSRCVLIQSKGLKPNTIFYPFFDGVAISTYCYAPTYIEYTLGLQSVDFDTSTNAGKDSKEDARQFDNNSLVCLNVGDVIKQGTTTAVVVGKHEDAGRKFLHVFNIKGGSFVPSSQGSTIQGSISGAIGYIVSVNPSTQPVGKVGNVAQHKSTPNGELNLIFEIPNTESVRFRVGPREFKLIDSQTNSSDFTSRGSAIYRAQGIIESRQNTVNSVRNAEIVRNQVSDTQTITNMSERPIGDTGWYDPLAQTFLVENRGGAFLTKVDIFFSSKDENIPVTLEIRDVVNGYPGKKVLPFSRITLNPNEINISTNTVIYDGVSTPKYDTPTTFKFTAPVYVNDRQEYCIVLLSDSNKYKVWISQMGDVIPDSDRTISQQPYAGVLFKSQNASTWTADQYQDLKFKIYKAKFDISGGSRVTFVNDIVPRQRLENDPIEFKAGTGIIRVFQKDHGFKPGDVVTLSGISSPTGNNIGGIPLSQLNNTHMIAYGPSSVQLDSYIIVLNGITSSLTGYFGGHLVTATRRYKYNVVQPILSTQTLPETFVLYRMNTTSHGDGVLEATSRAVMANENNVFYDNTKVITDGNVPSCRLVCDLVSNNDSVSPVIDTHRTSLILISNKINSPTELNHSYPGFDAIKWEAYKTFLLNELVHYNNKVYRVISSSGITNNPTQNPEQNTSSYQFVGQYFPFYADDTINSGTATYSNYLTRRIRLIKPSNLLKVMFSLNCPAQSDVEVYYRVSLDETPALFSQRPWVKLNPESPIVKTESGGDKFYEVSYIKDGPEIFGSFQIKLAMKSTTEASIPIIKDFRAIACSPL